MTDKLTAVGAYIFAGGFTAGVKTVFDVKAHLENGDYGVKTFKLNYPEIPVFEDPLNWPLEKFMGVNLVYCNPPCALFSPVGASLRNGKENWKTDKRLECHDHCFNLLKLKPDVLVIESVPMAYKRGLELWNERAEAAAKLGYAQTHLFEDCQYLGLPQKRARYLQVYHRHQLMLEPLNWAPPPSVGEVIKEFSDNPGYFHPTRADHLPVFKACGQGENVRVTWEKLNPPETWVKTKAGVRGRPRFCEYRANAREPIGAFIGDFVLHPTEHRKLGIEEAKAICGFPRDFKFSDERGAFSELARGVMPPVGAWFARSVAWTIQAKKKNIDRISVVDHRKPPAEAA